MRSSSFSFGLILASLSIAVCGCNGSTDVPDGGGLDGAMLDGSRSDGAVITSDGSHAVDGSLDGAHVLDGALHFYPDGARIYDGSLTADGAIDGAPPFDAYFDSAADGSYDLLVDGAADAGHFVDVGTFYDDGSTPREVSVGFDGNPGIPCGSGICSTGFFCCPMTGMCVPSGCGECCGGLPPIP